MIVEFFGLPGSGKTTAMEKGAKDHPGALTYHSAARSLKENHIRHFRLPEGKTTLWDCFLEYLEITRYLRDKNQLWGWTRIALRYAAPFRFLLRALEICAVYQYCGEQYGDRTVLVDHGMVQNMISLVYPSAVKSEERLKKQLAPLLNTENKYIYLFEDEGVCMKRIRNRKNRHGRLSMIEDDAELLEKLRIQQEMFRACYGILQGICPADGVILLDGKKNPHIY